MDGKTENGVLEFHDATNAETRLAIKGNGIVMVNNNIMFDPGGKLGIGEVVSPKAALHIEGEGTSGQTTAGFILENKNSGSFGMDITGAAAASRMRFLYGAGPASGTNSMTEFATFVLEGDFSGNARRIAAELVFRIECSAFHSYGLECSFLWSALQCFDRWGSELPARLACCTWRATARISTPLRGETTRLRSTPRTPTPAPRTRRCSGR